MQEQQSNVLHPRAESPPHPTPNSPWNHSRPPRVLQFLYCANTAASELRSHTQNSSVRNPTRPRPGALCLGWGHPAYSLTSSRTRPPRSPGASGPREGEEGSGWPFSARPRPLPFWGVGSASSLIFQGKCCQPTASRRPRAGGVGAVRACPQPCAESPHPPAARAQPGGHARSHQQPVLARQRPLSAVSGLGARDLDVDRGGARFAGSSSAGRQGHVLWASGGRRRVLAAQGAADGLCRVPQQVGDAAAAPTGLTPRRHGVFSVETRGRRVSGLLGGTAWARPGRAGTLGHLSAPSLGASLSRPLASLARSASTCSLLCLFLGRRPLSSPGSSHPLDRACLHVSGQPTASSPI